MNRAEVDEAAALLAAEYGLQVRPCWAETLGRTLTSLSEQMGLRPEVLLARLRTERDLRRRVAGALSVEESYFFRHSSHFSVLVEHLRGRLDDRTVTGPLTIWSAGCARGEEPYTIAMALCEAFGHQWRSRVQIVANDLSGRSIERAQAGRFAEWAFRETPEWARLKYFEPLGGGDEGGVQIKEELRRMVRFHALSLDEQLALLPVGGLEAVFFRNVAIYLERDALSSLYTRIVMAMRDGGLLFVAPSDPRPVIEGVSMRDIGETTIFVKRQRQPQPLPEAPRRPSQTANRRRQLRRPAPERRRQEPRRKQSSRQTGSFSDAAAMLAEDPTSKEGYSLRARHYLSRGAVDEANDDFRRALFIDGSDRVVRYLYVRSLLQAGRRGLARAQLIELRAQLDATPSEALLEDGETRASELREEVESLMETME